MEIEMDSENESQLKRIRKPSLLLSQEESLAKRVKKKVIVVFSALGSKLYFESLKVRKLTSKTCFYHEIFPRIFILTYNAAVIFLLNGLMTYYLLVIIYLVLTGFWSIFGIQYGVGRTFIFSGKTLKK